MNRTQLRTAIRTYIAEANPSLSYSSDADLNLYIDDGIKEMCIKAGVFLKPLSILVLNTVSTYLLPWDFLAVKSLLNQTLSPLEQADPTLIGRVYKVTGVPLHYYHLQSPLNFTTWTASTNYTTWDQTANPLPTYILPTATNGFFYECIVKGMSDIKEPSWGITPGSRFTDNNITWACRELISSLRTLILIDTPLDSYQGTGIYQLIYSALDEPLQNDNDSPNFAADLHRYLIPYACYRHFEKEKQPDLSSTFLNEFAQGLGLQPPAAGGSSAS
jgi:hypothetical protein